MDIVKNILFFCIQLFTINMYFSFTHYLFHKNKYLFKYIHYKHHELIIPQSSGSIYCHPFEHMFVNLTSILLPIIFQTNLICSCVLIAFVSYESVIGHTPFIGKRSRHHLHHKYFNVNFDNFPYVFDKWVLNTYRPSSKK